MAEGNEVRLARGYVPMVANKVILERSDIGCGYFCGYVMEDLEEIHLKTMAFYACLGVPTPSIKPSLHRLGFSFA
ncbi:MAG: hypothetical protein J0I01_08300 [Stenotrophomonas nitritireducens]|uniref:hypothetical protein n=1 Tax=Stenotrophomonas nitritireducens TaxID=83617 RepID=UPI001AC1117E|nr:hypothetical protein [Stenotrophomonas nitritireducens]MBN8769671.1 hypothetical protein [Stenotrophomonas sp.]MBN8792215.1 hypothetical protein [Stenotrophomonas nitritireducens]